MFTVQSLTAILNQLLPEPHAGLLAGILFGVKTNLDRGLYQALVTTGVLHIAALSGMNISLMTGFFGWLFQLVFSKRIASLLTVLSVVCFVWFVGPSASVVRSAIMASLTLIAIVFGRQNWALYSWILAVSCMLLLNFSWITDLSFQLSALATLGMILFSTNKSPSSDKDYFFSRSNSPSILSYQRNIVSFLVCILYQELRLTLAAQVFTIPLIFFHFHRISLISPITNILIGWMIMPVSVFGWIAAIVGYVYLPAAIIPAWGAWGLLKYLITVVTWTARIPFAGLAF